MTLHSLTKNSLAVLNHKILEANSQVQNGKLGGHQTCLSINRLWHELCDMLRRLVGTTAPGHQDCSILTASLPQATCSKSSLSSLDPPPSPTPSSAPTDSAPLEEQGEEGMDTVDNDLSKTQEEVPVVTKKPRIPPFFVSPKGDWRQLVALAKLIAPSFQSQMSGRFLKVTVADDVDYRALSK
ncbi:uncharacterized protein TNCV_3301981 [Trichonephila clavipes]|nr:uncharacterized protein TNCV_3301981 [Trichonephila clavipes]